MSFRKSEEQFGQDSKQLFRVAEGRLMGAALKLSHEAFTAFRAGAARAAGRFQPKLVASATEMTDAGLRKIRDGMNGASLRSFVKLMAADPELAALVERWAARLRQPDFFDGGPHDQGR